MGIKLLIFFLLALFNLFILNTINANQVDVDAFGIQKMHREPQTGVIAQRGGGGGGGRGGGGGGRAGGGGQNRGVSGRSGPSQSIQRTPSMSRAADVRQNIPTRNESVSRGPAQADTRNQVNQFIRNNPVSQPVNAQLGQQIGQQVGQSQRAVINARDNDSFNNIATNVRSNINNRYPDKGNWFNQKFFENHDYQPPYQDLRGNLWKAAAVAEVGDWLNLRNQPYYYGYDDDWGPNVYVDENAIQSQVIQTQVASNTQNVTSGSNWMTLGIFAISKSTESIASPNMFIQLALAKNGDIAGTFYNTTTNKVHELVGGVEEQSQRAFWKIADNPDSPFVETGIYNLTQNVTPIRVYYQNGEVKDLLLIRVES